MSNQYDRIKSGEIKLSVILHNRPHLRNDSFEYKFQIGYGLLCKLFDDLTIDTSVNTISLYFPERHINILEQRVLLDRILYYFPNIESINIETHSPFIVQSIPNGHLGVIQYKNQVSETNDFYTKLYNLDYV